MSQTLSFSRHQFHELAHQGYNYIPMISEVLADLDTPLSAYLKLAHHPYSYLLESVQGGEKWGRYSIIGLQCNERIEIYGKQVKQIQTVNQENTVVFDQVVDNPLDWIEQFQQQFNVPKSTHFSHLNQQPELPRFLGGLVGYFGYETIAYIEPRLSNILDKQDVLNTPDILLLISKELVVFDNLSGKLYIVVHADLNQNQEEQAWQQGIERLNQISQMLCHQSVDCNISRSSQAKNIEEEDFISGFTEQGYKRGVEKIKQYIKDGDTMQVVLSQRMSIAYDAPAIDVYRALRCINPSPYMYYFNMDDFYIVGASPEILTRVENDIITVRPIAGTRPRGKTHKQDQWLEQDLLADPKELAEHLMLIDLGRNDIGRVSQIGSVKLTEKMIVERYAHVMHIVSNVEGKLSPDVNVMDALKATFPAGTVSGAPKIRAMEIIDELEPIKRGIYSGAVGYYSWSGNLDTAIAIRTAIIKDNELHIQAGAGIVADSVAQNEWDETMNKGRSVFKAVAMAEQGFSLDNLDEPYHR